MKTKKTLYSERVQKEYTNSSKRVTQRVTKRVHFLRVQTLKKKELKTSRCLVFKPAWKQRKHCIQKESPKITKIVQKE